MIRLIWSIISINHWEYERSCWEWSTERGSQRYFPFFLQQFASDSWRRFTRQRLNPPVCSRDASAFGSDDFSWHELGGEPINKGNMKHKGGDNYERKLLAINQIGKTCPEIGIGYPPPPSKSPHSSSLKWNESTAGIKGWPKGKGILRAVTPVAKSET